MQETRLSDGRPILIRRVTPADSPALADGFARLSAESRQLRFLAPKNTLTDAELRYLTEVDGHHHEALGAIDPATQQGIGIARFVRDREDPARAEVAVTVADEWQRQGVATALLTCLSDRAREEGVRYFTAMVAPENRSMRHVLDRLGKPVRVVETGRYAVHYEIEVAPAGLGEELRAVLRAAAAGQLPPPRSLWHELRALMPVQLHALTRGGADEPGDAD